MGFVLAQSCSIDTERGEVEGFRDLFTLSIEDLIEVKITALLHRRETVVICPPAYSGHEGFIISS